MQPMSQGGGGGGGRGVQRIPIFLETAPGLHGESFLKMLISLTVCLYEAPTERLKTAIVVISILMVDYPIFVMK